MTSTPRRNQIAWQQFSIKFGDRESGRSHHEFLDACQTKAREDWEETFDISVPDPKRANTEKHTTEKHTATTKRTKTAATASITPPAAEKTEHEHVQKAKTRAERHPPIEAEIPTPIQLTKKHIRTKRSDYWVHQDDVRMNRARMLKMNRDRDEE